MIRILLVVALVNPAHADPEKTPVTVGVNLPFGWPSARSFGASVGVGITEHQAIRANVASYESTEAIAIAVALVAGGDGDEASRSGRTTDVGLAWTYFPRAVFDGFSVELGGLMRRPDLQVDDQFANPPSLGTHTTTLAGRALIGWSWTGRHMFVSASAGLSVGRESGTETKGDDLNNKMSVTTSVHRLDVEAEAIVRVGIAFDL